MGSVFVQPCDCYSSEKLSWLPEEPDVLVRCLSWQNGNKPPSPELGFEVNDRAFNLDLFIVTHSVLLLWFLIWSKVAKLLYINTRH